jgi:hypothetical protein
LSAQPLSGQAQIRLRLLYLTSSFAAISLDFALVDQALRSQGERRQSIINSIRYGEAEGLATLPMVRAVIALAQKYTQNGPAVRKQIEYGFSGNRGAFPPR